MVPSCQPGTTTSSSPHQPDAWFPRQPADAPEMTSGTLCPRVCCFLGSGNDCRETASGGHSGGRVPGSLSPLSHTDCLTPQASQADVSLVPSCSQSPAPLGSAPRREGLLVCFSRRQQHPSRQRKHSGVPLRVAWHSGTWDPKLDLRPSSSSGFYQFLDLISLSLSLLNCKRELIMPFTWT